MVFNCMIVSSVSKSHSIISIIYISIGFFNPSSSSTVNLGVVDLNSGKANSVTVKATWNLISRVDNFDFVSPSGGEQTWTAPYTGYYKLEVWGASGGNGDGDDSQYAGKGGFSRGTVKVSKNIELFVYVGQQGYRCDGSQICTGTFGGGGSGFGRGNANLGLV